MAIKYVVNEDAKVVTAIIKVDPYSLRRKLRSMGGEFELYDSSGSWQDLGTKDKYVGVARLNPKDTWNVETGKLVARNKAFKKYYKDCVKLLESVLNSQALKSTKKLCIWYEGKLDDVNYILENE